MPALHAPEPETTDAPTFEQVPIGPNGLPRCHCGNDRTWREVGDTLYTHTFTTGSGADWHERLDYIEADEPAYVECPDCDRTYSAEGFPRP